MLNTDGYKLDTDKIMMDLVAPGFTLGIARVLTIGAQKYPPYNWAKGMSWTRVYAALQRHLTAYLAGEDYDPETGELHLYHAGCCLMMLSEYYTIFPQGDDRQHLRQPRIGLDIDGVLADFVGAYEAQFGVKTPEFWNFDPDFLNNMTLLDDDFYMGIKPLVSPSELGFEPACYITSRECPKEVTEAWLHLHGFPAVPVFSNVDKVSIAQKEKIDWFVDDRYENFVALSGAGFACFLIDQPWNRRFNVGYRRLYSLSELWPPQRHRQLNLNSPKSRL